MSNHPRRHMNRQRGEQAVESHVVPVGLSHGYMDNPAGPEAFVVIHAVDDHGDRIEWVIATAHAVTLAAGLCDEIKGALDCPDYIEAKERFQ